MKKFIVSTLFIGSLINCGGEASGFPLRRSPGIVDLSDFRAMQEELEVLKQEIAEIKKASTTHIVVSNKPGEVEPMDMVVSCVSVDGVQQKMICDVPNCHDVARNMWFSVDTGIMFKRCDKHKDGVVVK